MNEEKLKEMAKPNKVGRAREFLQQGRKDEVYGDNEYYRKGFLDGGLYADEHPKNPLISVEERLPENGQHIFATGKIGENGIWHKLGIYGKDSFFNMRYWMPIPELPKED